MAAKLSGGGKKRFDLGQNADINVTPFVDVMLVLLIIFMVTAPLATVSIKIDIPPAQAPTTLDTMAASVAQSLGVANPTTQQVFIRADPHVKYGIFMGVVNRLQIDGYYKIGLISEEVQS